MLTILFLALSTVPYSWKCGNEQPSQMRASKGYLLRACYPQGVTTITCVLAETEKQAEDWESSTGKKREGFRCTVRGGWWRWEARSRLTRSGECDRLGVCIWLSLIGPKQSQKLGKLSVIKSQPLGASCYRSYCLVFQIVARANSLTSTSLT